MMPDARFKHGPFMPCQILQIDRKHDCKAWTNRYCRACEKALCGLHMNHSCWNRKTA